MKATLDPEVLAALEGELPVRLEADRPLASYTSSRLGGRAEALVKVRDAGELARVSQVLWAREVPFRILGGGSNVLIADTGVSGVVVLNQAKEIWFTEGEDQPQVWAESGASLGGTARRVVERGLGGMEWAGTIPGTVGGAIVGNAGAHGSDVASCLQAAEILQHGLEPESWSAERLEYGYRDSWLKRNPGSAVVLSGGFRLSRSTVAAAKQKLADFAANRQATQPGGATWGSMFKNPPGDYAGRLIEAAGLKGHRCGGAEISTVHANFFVNLGDATAAQVLELIRTAQEKVKSAFGVELEPEIEFFGDWEGLP